MPDRPPPIAAQYDSAVSSARPEASFATATRQGTPPPRTNSLRTVWPRTLGRHHDDVHLRARLDQAEMDVEPMREGDGRAVAEVLVDVRPVGLGLQLVRHGHHQHVGPGGGLGDAHDLDAGPLGLGGGGRAGAQRGGDLSDAGIVHVQRVRMALAAIAHDSHPSVLDEVYVAVAIVVDAHPGLPLLFRVVARALGQALNLVQCWRR